MKLESMFSDVNNVTFYDNMSCRYFRAPLLLVLKLLNVHYLKLNDFYTIVGLPMLEKYGNIIVHLKCECCLETLSEENMERIVYMLSE